MKECPRCKKEVAALGGIACDVRLVPHARWMEFQVCSDCRQDFIDAVERWFKSDAHWIHVTLPSEETGDGCPDCGRTGPHFCTGKPLPPGAPSQYPSRPEKPIDRHPATVIEAVLKLIPADLMATRDKLANLKGASLYRSPEDQQRTWREFMKILNDGLPFPPQNEWQAEILKVVSNK